MARARHLPNAPITEAIIDFRVKLPSGFAPETLKGAQESLKDRFPTMEEHRAMQAVVELKSGVVAGPETTDLGIRGYFFRSADGRNVAQFRTDGFTYNRLKPYTQWKEFFPEARDLWTTYLRAARPEVVTRLAVRCINHIRIPSGAVDFDEYFTAGPKVPRELPQTIGSFLTRVVILNAGAGSAAIVTQALEPSLDPRFTTVIVDIDVYKVKDWQPSDPELLETFELLHEFRNQVFFSHITEATARLFE